MKIVLILIATLCSATSLAEIPSYTCGYGEIETLATYGGTSSQIKTLNISDGEAEYLERVFDDAWNCDEGVRLLGAKFDYSKGKKVQYEALCSRDSLGTTTVELNLTCKETYLN